MKDYRAIHDFDNGYSASVIRRPGSYGYSSGLYELAVLRHGRVDATTPITDDVLGWLTMDKVNELLKQIEALPKK